MKENKQHFCILCFIISRKVKTTETQKKICAACREGTVIDGTCQKWLTEFHAGNFSPDDAPWLGRAVEVGSDQIETSIENNQGYTKWELADIHKILKSVKLLVKMKNVSFILQRRLYELFGQSNS